MSDDAQLMKRVAAGEVDAFEVLLTRYERKIYNMVCRMVGDNDEAADITQIVFVKAYEKSGRYNSAYKFFSWLYRIAINETLSHLRRRQRTTPLGERDFACERQTPESDYVEQERCAYLQGGLRRLTLDDRLLLILKYFLQLSYQEIGGILEIPEKTVKSRLFTSRRRLRTVLVGQGYVG
jgi:RNA polymerase sigma-70 factor (ECF subfamily)